MKPNKDARRALMLSEFDIAVAALGAMRRLVFVQVGANDGKTGDPVFKHIMQYADFALLVEPQPWLVEPIRANYKHFTGKLFIESIAVGATSGTLDIYYLKEEHWSEYIQKVGRDPNQIASPIRHQLVKRLAPRLGLSMEQAEKYVGVVHSKVKPLSDLIPEYGLEAVDVLQIDCEGWDVNVITSLGSYRPLLIHFESFNLTDEDWGEFVTWSKEAGYGFLRMAKNTLAIKGLSARREL